jgi:hypothetical protein
MTQLVREGLRDEEPLISLRLLTRGRTVSLFWQLDPHRKRALLQRVHEAGLINLGEPVIGLSGADLREAYLRELTLSKADLRGDDINGANLGDANLRDADLTAYCVDVDPYASCMYEWLSKPPSAKPYVRIMRVGQPH